MSCSTHWSICRTAVDVVENPLSAKDKLGGKLLTQLLPRLTTKTVWETRQKTALSKYLYKFAEGLSKHHYHHHHHQSLNREGRWGTTNDLATSFLHFPCFPLPSGTWRTPGLSSPWCCLPISSFVRFVFFPLSLCLARWFWPDLMNGRHDHTTTVCVSLRLSGDLHVVQLPAGSWHGLPRW